MQLSRASALRVGVGVALRAAAWALLFEEYSLFPLRVGMASMDDDTRSAFDALHGYPTAANNALYAPFLLLPPALRPAAFACFCVAVDVLVGEILAARHPALGFYAWVVNPAAVVSCVLSSANVPVLLTAAALSLFFSADDEPAGARRRLRWCALLLGVCSYFRPVACGCLALAVTGGSGKVSLLGWFAGAAGCVGYLGWSLGDVGAGGWMTCIVRRPNWGLHWYVHLEVFDAFRDMFCAVLVLLTPGIALPFVYKLVAHGEPASRNASVAVAAAWAVCVVTALTPTLVEYVGSFALLYAASPDAWGHLRFPLLTLVWTVPICCCLHVLFIVAWTQYQSANPNFFYFVNLAWGVILGATALEVGASHALMVRSRSEKSKKD
ncbi:hypothetical protein DIPPA_08292 [Diplonema papillatum]|nr:hypothetical protein DIPPA_08292 [Diplonema papillatum]